MSDTGYIGKTHNKDLPNDAIHIAIAQVVAGEVVNSGDPVGFKDGKEGIVYKDVPPIGIVDPFLQGTINKDVPFYLFLYPNTVTSLTHQWEHPAFNRTPERIAEAKKWLDDNGEDRYDDEGDYVYGDKNSDRFIEEFSGGTMDFFWAHGDDFSDRYRENADNFRKKFWDNLEIVTGKVASPAQRAQEYFKCSC